MVLLTSSTVSVILTSSIVILSTFFLFLSGYALQQQSVRSIQHALRPPNLVPDTRFSTPQNIYSEEGPTKNIREKRNALSDEATESAEDYFAAIEKAVSGGSNQQNPLLKNGDGDNSGYGAQEEDIRSGSSRPGNYAYLQLLSDPDPSNICSAILFFKKLADGGSVIQDRLFMYPRDWDTDYSHSSTVSKALSLLRAAGSKYNFWTLPIDLSIVTRQGYTKTDTKLLQLGEIQFMPYNGVLYLRSPGYLLDAEKLDQVLLSKALPGKYEKSRTESFNNEAWIPMPLRAEREARIPPAYLVTVYNDKDRDRVVARTHIPNVMLREFGDLVAGPGYTRDNGEPPAYVHFDHDMNGQVQWDGNPYFGAWRREQNEVCEGLNLDYLD